MVRVPDPQKVTELMREVATEDILPRFRRLHACDIREKKPGNLVTVADEAAEKHLAAGLRALLPGSELVGEEGVAADPEMLRHVSADSAVWIVDPIDGTANYCAGKEIFAVMVALASGGETLAAWILDPVAGEMLSAVKGEGAWLNGTRVHVAAPVAPEQMIGAWSYKSVQDKKRRHGLKRYHLFHGDPGDFRCAGRDYMELARGRRHFTNYWHLMPWDHAPGVLLHREAGGYSAFADDGQSYSVMRTGGPLLCAPDRDSWQALRRFAFDGIMPAVQGSLSV
jgi:fructose-1,6-bisphosphatase/inositol monophosphatase family enzyme